MIFYFQNDAYIQINMVCVCAHAQYLKDSTIFLTVDLLQKIQFSQNKCVHLSTHLQQYSNK